MMKRFFTLMTLLVCCVAVMAIPAKKGISKTLVLGDGTEVKATLVGDEFGHFWRGADGKAYTVNGDLVEEIDAKNLIEIANKRRSVANAARSKRLMAMMRNVVPASASHRVAMGDRTNFYGQKKGLVILVQFTDVRFQTANNLAKYKRIMNEEGYSEGSFRGSVSDYFKAQSNNQFELDFDVVGPYTLSKKQSYYGENDQYGNDMHAEEMITEACTKADAEVNFSDYDWDGDGEVDQVFVLYAGKGEADGGSESTIWPHMYTLEEGLGNKYSFDGVYVNTYACANEVNPNNGIEGIGCFCHEFSHCMGFPDFYDIAYNGWFGMSDFDLMCSGSYNGDLFCPAGYTAHEKMMCGWQEPFVLAEKDSVVNDVLSMSDHGATFIIYNDAHPDEYYMIENRQKKGWDTAYPARGLMITHVDFDKNIWEYNCPDTEITKNSDYYKIYGFPLNDHQRMTIVHADNDDDLKYWDSYNGYYTKSTLSTDLYPYSKKDSLTALSKPALFYYNKDSKGSKTPSWRITNITQNADGSMSFHYYATSTGGNNGGGQGGENTGDGDFEKVTSDDQLVAGWNYVLVNESNAKGNGSFDSKYFTAIDVVVSGNTVSGDDLVPMVLGGNANGYSFSVDGQYLTTSEPKKLSFTNSESTVWLIESTADGYVVTTDGFGTIQYNSASNANRFMNYTSNQKPAVLYVQKPATAIQTIDNDAVKSSRIYTLDGRYVGSDLNALSRGIYILNGKKVMK